ncbi:uncharacterized protein LOC129602198 [Paramacrobiotus metropolitanus]|uniref:uncharacterized protein LOC129602198 n=1 Tax=Paramacrobiotus metropolitanus TaxID=2943436 RepID=UPI0024465553|nr:uncharacterized protein LOC129602198 [Paramacrobiotus metropolitanus]
MIIYISSVRTSLGIQTSYQISKTARDKNGKQECGSTTGPRKPTRHGNATEDGNRSRCTRRESPQKAEEIKNPFKASGSAFNREGIDLSQSLTTGTTEKSPQTLEKLPKLPKLTEKTPKASQSGKQPETAAKSPNTPQSVEKLPEIEKSGFGSGSAVTHLPPVSSLTPAALSLSSWKVGGGVSNIKAVATAGPHQQPGQLGDSEESGKYIHLVVIEIEPTAAGGYVEEIASGTSRRLLEKFKIWDEFSSSEVLDPILSGAPNELGGIVLAIPVRGDVNRMAALPETCNARMNDKAVTGVKMLLAEVVEPEMQADKKLPFPFTKGVLEKRSGFDDAFVKAHFPRVAKLLGIKVADQVKPDGSQAEPARHTPYLPDAGGQRVVDGQRADGDFGRGEWLCAAEFMAEKTADDTGN